LWSLKICSLCLTNGLESDYTLQSWYLSTLKLYYVRRRRAMLAKNMYKSSDGILRKSRVAKNLLGE
jgi:hypothetical protein